MKPFHKIFLIFLVLILAGFIVVQSVAAQSRAVSLNWVVIGAGGIGATGGDVSIQSTLGQPVVGVVSEGDVIIQSGFWYGLAEFLYQLFLPLLMR